MIAFGRLRALTKPLGQCDMFSITIRKNYLVFLFFVLPFSASVGKTDHNFLVSPITQREACERLSYWYDNFLSPEFGAQGAKSIGSDWIDKLFNECSTIKPQWNAQEVGNFFQFIFKGDPAKLQLDFLITMSLIKDRPNTVWVLLSTTTGSDMDSQTREKYEHNLEVVAYHLKTGVAKTELLQK